MNRETRTMLDNVALAIYDFGRPYSETSHEDISWIFGQLESIRRGERADPKVLLALKDIRDTVDCMDRLRL